MSFFQSPKLYLECILEEVELLWVVCVVVLEDLRLVIGPGDHLVPDIQKYSISSSNLMGGGGGETCINSG